MPVARSALEEMKDGAFVRTASTFREWVSSEEGAKFPCEAGRYHLFVSYACPWAHRTLVVRALKGLEDVIGVSVTHPTWMRSKPDDENDTHCGWGFKSDSDAVVPPSGRGSVQVSGCVPPPEGFDFKTIRDIFESQETPGAKYTVPVLFDKKTKTIVNTESSEIIQMLNTQFNAVAKKPELDLSPASTQAKQEEVNEWIYSGINDGVYKCGFASTQAAYDSAVVKLFDSLDKCEDVLSKSRYLTGDQLTLADIRLWVTLFRFDEVYIVYFKCNKRSIASYPNLLNYVRELYQMEGVPEISRMDHIKTHYFTSHPHLNTASIVPMGPDFVAELEKPHDRERAY